MLPSSLALQGVQLIGITGPAGSGKTSLADCLEGLGFRAYSFAGPLKMMLTQIPGMEKVNGDDREWKEQELHPYGKSPRKFMQTLGTEWGRQMIHEDIWVMMMDQKIRNKVDMRISKRFCFPDLRYPNEVKWLRENGGFVIHLKRDSLIRVNPHSSEIPLPYEQGDVGIDNNGPLAQLEVWAKTLAEESKYRSENPSTAA